MLCAYVQLKPRLTQNFLPALRSVLRKRGRFANEVRLGDKSGRGTYHVEQRVEKSDDAGLVLLTWCCNRY